MEGGILDVKYQTTALQQLSRNSDTLLELLKAMRTTNQELFLVGGTIRNLVWDHLHAYPTTAQFDDVDVVYFNQLNASKAHDKALEEQLSKVAPNMKWSVKNQARMHTINNEQPYQSLEDAISRFPETATAVAVRLDQEGELEILAPLGLSDLFRLIVSPTPTFAKRRTEYDRRIDSKKWEDKWPKLRFF
ncbi:MAG: nucleotidyltransferase family protein [Pseudomonadales bacterium]|nr:nucleotidyltransferase family protein [Pseudomonadales bacterium]